MLGSGLRGAPTGRVHDPWERDVTASPDSSVDKMPPSPCLQTAELSSSGCTAF